LTSSAIALPTLPSATAFVLVSFLLGLCANLGALFDKQPLHFRQRVEVDLAPMLGGKAVVGVVHGRGDKALESDLAQAVDDGAELVDGLVEVVGVLLQEGDEEVLSSRAVVPHRSLRPAAREALPGVVGVGRLLDAELSEPLVQEPQLVLATEQQRVELVHVIARVPESPCVAGRGDEEPDERDVEATREGENLLGVELAMPALITALDPRDRRLGEAHAEKTLETVGDVILGPAVHLPRPLEVVGDDLVQIRAARLADTRLATRVAADPPVADLPADTLRLLPPPSHHFPILTTPTLPRTSPSNILLPRDTTHTAHRHLCIADAGRSVAPMMSLTPMAPSAWRYYVEEVARGREDYYSLSAEHPGRFMGRGAEALGLSGTEADALALERLFGNGADPRDGSPLGRGFSPKDSRAVAGFALTCSPPKSVSALWALADSDTAAEVAAAHDAAVATALAFVDEHGSFTRRGHNGVLQVDTDGLIAAGFVHRTSRAVDPQLHTHLLVSNKVRAEDGKWLSLDGRELFETQKAAGMLYKAALRSELTARLGVAFTQVDENGVAEIAGVPVMLVDQWSARRHELKAVGDELIADREVELGRTLFPNERAECFQIAAYRTRTPKIDADTSTEELRAHWLAEAEEWGVGPERWLGGVTGRATRRALPRPDRVVPEVIACIEERSATWGRADVVEEVSRLVMGADAGTTRQRVEMLADRVLRDAGVVSLAGPLPAEAPASLRRRDGMAAVERHGAVRFSTRKTLLHEAAILEAAATGKDAHLGVVAEELADRVLGASELGDDQREAVRGLLLGGEAVALLIGPAGTGKSRALDAARLAWEQAGYHPVGLAPSAMAAAVLSEAAGLASETLARFLVETARTGSPLRLDHRSVVILDEAAMARSDDLAKLMFVVQRAKGKLVLAGDHHQLGAVGPGGIFRTLVFDRGAHELETVRRFEHAWEAAASLRLRARDPAILRVYLRHERITDGNREHMIDRAFAAWQDAREAGTSILLMAGDNATADEVARRCRAELVDKGRVGRDGVRIASGLAGYGDEIVTLRNDRRLRTEGGDFVRNGARWQVTGTSKNGSMRVVSAESGAAVTLPPGYVREHVALGYALTIHKAQGQTTGRAIVLVDEHMTAAQFYVAMSRGRQENRAFVISSDDKPEDHVNRPSLGTVELLTRVMRHDEVDRSAHDEMRRNLARYEDIALLKDLSEEAAFRIDHEAGRDRREEIASLEPRAKVDEASLRLEAAERTVRRAQHQTTEATARCVEAEQEPIRARLPGRIGADARKRSERQRGYARWALEVARGEEQQALRHCEEARLRLGDAQNVARELATLGERQARRESWLRDHPDEVKWARQIGERIDARTHEGTGLATRADRSIEPEAGPGDGRPSRLPRARRPDDASLESRNEYPVRRPRRLPVTEAVLRPSGTTTAEPWQPPPGRERPVLER